MCNISIYIASYGVILGNFQLDLNILLQIWLQLFITEVRDAFLFVKGEVAGSSESLNLEGWVIFPYGLDGDIIVALGEVELQLSSLPEVKLVRDDCAL